MLVNRNGIQRQRPNSHFHLKYSIFLTIKKAANAAFFILLRD